MRIFVLAAALSASLVPVAAAADAQSWHGRGNGYAYGPYEARDARQCRRALARGRQSLGISPGAADLPKPSDKPQLAQR